jgi:hypothetical protein
LKSEITKAAVNDDFELLNIILLYRLNLRMQI